MESLELEVIEIPPSKRCEKCRRWSAGGQRHPEAPPGIWGLCLRGEPSWSNRHFGCAEYVSAPRIKRAVVSAPEPKAEQLDLLGAAE